MSVSVHMNVCQSYLCLSVSSFLCVSVCVSVYPCLLSVCLDQCMSVCSFLCLSVWQSVHLSPHQSYTKISTYFSVHCVPVPNSLHINLHFRIHISTVPVYLSVCPTTVYLTIHICLSMQSLHNGVVTLHGLPVCIVM